jgi:signal transduction histidine kinase
MPYIYYATYIWVTAVLILSLGIVIYLGSKKISSRLFSFSVMLVAIWSIIDSFLPLQTDSFIEIVLFKLTFSLGILIASTFLYFCKSFPDDVKPDRILLYRLILWQFIFNGLLFGSSLIIDYSFPTSGLWGWGYRYGPFWFVFDFSFLFLWTGGVIILFRKFQKMPRGHLRKNIGCMLMSSILGFIPPNIFSIMLPRLGIYDLNWLGPVSGCIWVCIISYSILRYRQMDVRAVVTEVLAIAMTAIFFLNIFIDTPFGVLGRIAAFIAFLILAYYLIRGVMRESKQREELSELNRNLEAKVAEKTAEVRKAYAAEQHARMGLEKLNDAKDQFILMAQHNLRAPISSLNTTIGSVLDESHSNITPDTKIALESMWKPLGRLTSLADELLNITRLKAGSSILDLKPSRLKLPIEEILTELKIPISELSLHLEYPHTDTEWPMVQIDLPKIHECLFVILDNAVRYNKEDGFIRIRTSTDKDVFVLDIENSGLGISAEEAEKIGSSLFYRGRDARSAYPIGMGVGLSVVKAIIRAHQGSFKIESAGPGKGARVTVTLPLVRQAVS